MAALILSQLKFFSKSCHHSFSQPGRVWPYSVNFFQVDWCIENSAIKSTSNRWSVPTRLFTCNKSDDQEKQKTLAVKVIFFFEQPNDISSAISRQLSKLLSLIYSYYIIGKLPNHIIKWLSKIRLCRQIQMKKVNHNKRARSLYLQKWRKPLGLEVPLSFTPGNISMRVILWYTLMSRKWISF